MIFKIVRTTLFACLMAIAFTSQASFLGADWKAPVDTQDTSDSTCD